MQEQTAGKPQTAPKSKQNGKPKRKKSNLSGIMAFLVLFLAAYLILSLLTVAFIWYSFNSGAENDDIYSVRIYHDENLLYKISTTDANNEYGLYIPFEYLAEISSFGLAGNGDDMTLFIIGTDNRIKCTKNSSLVVINDNAVRISSPILYEDGEYFIPVTLIENYINGIDVAYDNEDMICNISIGVSKNNIELNLLLPDPMENAYFPESYKYYDYDNTLNNSTQP
ncbi:MAG: hypothetical protein IKZ23_04385 [Clostridia bacterium]|nr:hypothetical protein [Clostridia bacterium]